MRIDGQAHSVASLKFPYLLQLLEEIPEVKDVFNQEVKKHFFQFSILTQLCQLCVVKSIFRLDQTIHRIYLRHHLHPR